MEPGRTMRKRQYGRGPDTESTIGCYEGGSAPALQSPIVIGKTDYCRIIEKCLSGDRGRAKITDADF